jgi:hypothetical protein
MGGYTVKNFNELSPPPSGNPGCHLREMIDLEAHIGVIALLDIHLIWFGYIARLSQWGERDVLLVQIISTCRHWLRGGDQHPVDVTD